jgi:hypothetical protein
MSPPTTPGLCFALVEDVRAGALAVFQRYAAALQEPGLDGPVLWLVFNALAGRLSAEDLNEVAAFVGDPAPQIDRVLGGGYLEIDGEHYRATPKAAALAERLSGISENANREWREEITRGGPAETLDQTLLTLWGKLAVPNA